MGTTYSIKVVPTKRIKNSETIHAQIKQQLNLVNTRMSTYLPSSELSVFNQQIPVDQWHKFSSPTFYVLATAQKISQQSNGVFDITIGKLVNLWGFGPSGTAYSPPHDSAIRRIHQKIGYKYLELNDQNQSAKKTSEQLYLDFSSIAKGYAVDLVKQSLEFQGFQHFLIEVGGEVYVSGYKNPETRKRWKVAINQPILKKQSSKQVFKTIFLHNTCIATSGNYHNSFYYKGKLYSHTINPQTGYPIQHQLSSVTVLHPSCMHADAFATAIMVMGNTAGFAWAKKNHIAALLIYKNKEILQELTTPEFNLKLKESP